MNLILFESEWKNTEVNRYAEALSESHLKYLASDFLGLAFNNLSGLNQAVIRAARTITVSGLTAQSHFKPVFISKDGGLSCDWKISSLARKLILLNANPENPLIARMQLELLSADEEK